MVVLKPFQSLYVDTGQHTLFVETTGKSTAPACVLIPGAMQGTWGWSDSFCSKIADAGFFVVRFDLRDIGRSSATPEGVEYDLGDLAGDVVSILDALHIEQAHLVGHSMGGHLCQQLAVDYPERVLSITPIGSGPIGATSETGKPLTDSEQAILKKTWEIFLGRKDSEDLEEHIQGFLRNYKYLSGTAPFDEEMARTYVSRMIAFSPKQFLQPGNPHERVMRRLGETLEEQKGVLGKIKAPTLLIHGELDPIALPRFAISMADEIPQVTLKIVPGMGHMFLSRELEEILTDAIIEHMQASA